nr:MAG TPA_asm: Regulatory protein [Caudoviricetes sp.]
MAFSEKLKALRFEHKLTQDELGEKLYLSRASIQATKSEEMSLPSKP